jgi:hypothetical protein
MRWILVAFALTAAPAAAQDCFVGEPRQVSYDTGRVIKIIQRHGDDVTFTTPYEGFQDAVTKTQLMLFPKQARAGARSTEHRWTSRLPKLRDLVPGFQFDLEGTIKSGGGEPLPYRIVGSVLGEDVVQMGACPYPVLVISLQSFVDDQPVSQGTYSLSPEMKVVLQSTVEVVASGTRVASVVVGLQ